MFKFAYFRLAKMAVLLFQRLDRAKTCFLCGQGATLTAPFPARAAVRWLSHIVFQLAKP